MKKKSNPELESREEQLSTQEVPAVIQYFLKNFDTCKENICISFKQLQRFIHELKNGNLFSEIGQFKR